LLFPDLLIKQIEFENLFFRKIFYLEDQIYLSFFLTILSYQLLVNAFNMSDGHDGISSLIAISVISYILIFKLSKNYFFLMMPILTSLLLFLIYNIKSKIFLGDSGAYLLGFLIGTLVIVFFIRNPDAPKWLAILILAYPFFELIFSFLRKILLRQSPFEPDKKHLHLMVNDLTQSIYKKMNTKRHNNLRANNMNTVTLIFFWLSPLYFVYAHLAYNTPIFNLLTFYINIYLFFYLFISNILRDKK
jgi:UDP-N-acetylmuramyl pentapeptide phosphotransferase/UDP-N-acetylglucosamine-1-phosphate transferase